MNFCIAGYLRIKSSPNNAICFIKTNLLEVINIFDQVLVQLFFSKFFSCGLSKPGGGITQEIFIRGGSAPKSNPIPFYIPFFTKGSPFVYLLLTNGTPFTYLV